MLPFGRPNDKSGKPDKGLTLGHIASKTILAVSDPMLPAPKEKPPE
jgi:hypothetical protein